MDRGGWRATHPLCLWGHKELDTTERLAHFSSDHYSAELENCCSWALFFQPPKDQGSKQLLFWQRIHFSWVGMNRKTQLWSHWRGSIRYAMRNPWDNTQASASSSVDFSIFSQCTRFSAFPALKGDSSRCWAVNHNKLHWVFSCSL